MLVGGQTVRTYSAKNIMTFSRVFTGLWARLPRGNVEKENWETLSIRGTCGTRCRIGIRLWIFRVVVVVIYILLAARPIRLITVLGMFSSVLRTCQ